MSDKSSLLRLILCGAALRIYVDTTKMGKVALRKFLTSYAISDWLALFSDKTFRFITLAFRGLQMRMKLADELTYNLVKDLLHDVPIPDGVDLVDAVGKSMSESNFIGQYDNVPFIREFIDALHDFGKADFEFGIHSEAFTFSFGGFTEGIKELFDLVIQGMTE